MPKATGWLRTSAGNAPRCCAVFLGLEPSGDVVSLNDACRTAGVIDVVALVSIHIGVPSFLRCRQMPWVIRPGVLIPQ